MWHNITLPLSEKHILREEGANCSIVEKRWCPIYCCTGLRSWQACIIEAIAFSRRYCTGFEATVPTIIISGMPYRF